MSCSWRYRLSHHCSEHGQPLGDGDGITAHLGQRHGTDCAAFEPYVKAYHPRRLRAGAICLYSLLDAGMKAGLAQQFFAFEDPGLVLRCTVRPDVESGNQGGCRTSAVRRWVSYPIAWIWRQPRSEN